MDPLSQSAPSQVADQNTGSALNDLVNKNLRFFCQFDPQIYQALITVRTKNSQLAFNKQTQKMDVFENRVSLYQGDMHAYVNAEVSSFMEVFAKGQSFQSTRASDVSAYGCGRFFSQSLIKTMKACGIDEPSAQQTQAIQNGIYTMQDFSPMVLVFSVGLHIQALVEKQEVMHLIIFESDVSRIQSSLGVVDWEKIVKRFDQKGRSIRLILDEGFSAKQAKNQSIPLWNALNRYTPMFPLMTHIYNHRAEEKYLPLIERLQTDITINYNLWGMYDDEINQFNNALHNLSAPFKQLPNKKQLACKEFPPVCIVGSGPSLDMRIDDLKMMADSSIIISCGTALQALHAHGIQPDFHVELESHYVTYESCIKKLADDDANYLKGIVLLASAQITPKACEPFLNSILFFKDSSALSYIYSNSDEAVAHTTPTCTNAALAIFMHLGVQDILFFGCDYGFIHQQHHAKGSIYFDEYASDYIKSHTQEQNSKTESELIKITSVHGQNMGTTGIYYTALRCIENSLRQYSGRAYNCSEGANIAGSEYLPVGFLERHSESSKLPFSAFDKEGFIQTLLVNSRPELTSKKLASGVRVFNDGVNEICLSLLKLVENTACENTLQATELAYELIFYLENTVKKQYGGLYFLLRGSVWHYLHLLLSHGMCTKESSFFLNWQLGFIQFLNALPQHSQNVTNKAYPDPLDPWIHGGIEQVPESFNE